MRRLTGAGLLGLALLGAPSASVFADDPEGEPMPAMEEESGSNRNLILAAVLAVVVIGGGIALGRRG